MAKSIRERVEAKGRAVLPARVNRILSLWPRAVDALEGAEVCLSSLDPTPYPISARCAEDIRKLLKEVKDV